MLRSLVDRPEFTSTATRLLFDLRQYSLQILAEPLAHRGSPIVFLF